MSGPAIEPIKLMTQFNLNHLRLIKVAIKRHDIKTNGSMQQEIERDVEDFNTISKLVNLTGWRNGKLFRDIAPNKIELSASDYASSTEFPQVPTDAELAPSSRGRTSSCSSEEDSKERRSKSRSREKYKKEETKPEPKSRRRSPDRYSSPSSSRSDKRNRERSPSRSRRRRSRSSRSRSRSHSRGRSVSPPPSKHSRSPHHRSKSPVRNLSNRPGEFRPDKGHSSRRRDRHSRSRSPSPSYRSRRHSRERSPGRHRRKRSRSKSQPKIPAEIPEMYDGFAEYGMNMFNPAMMGPDIRPPMVMRYPYAAPMPYYRAPAIPSYHMPPRFYQDPMCYRPRRPLPVYNNRALPKFYTVTVTATTTTSTDVTMISSKTEPSTVDSTTTAISSNVAGGAVK